MKPIYFHGGIPSNWHRATILLPNPINGKMQRWGTNEHYFHVVKGLYLLDDYTAIRVLRICEEIRKAPGPAEAKALGRALPLSPEDIADWDNGRAVQAMLTCNVAKYQQHDYCREWLANTGDRGLVEHARDRIWGDGLNGTGRNLMGKTLELVRALVC